MAKRKEKQIRTPKPNTVGDTPFEVVDVKGKEFVVIEKNTISGKALKNQLKTNENPQKNHSQTNEKPLLNLFGTDNNPNENLFETDIEPKKNVPYSSKKQLKPREKKTRRQYLREYAKEVKLISRFKFVLFYAKRPHYYFIKGVSNRFVKELNKRLDTDHSRTLVNKIVKVMKRNLVRKIRIVTVALSLLCVVGTVLYYRYTSPLHLVQATQTAQHIEKAAMMLNWNLYKANKHHVITGSYTNRAKAESIPYKLHVIQADNKYRVCVFCANNKQEALLQSQLYNESWIYNE